MGPEFNHIGLCLYHEKSKYAQSDCNRGECISIAQNSRGIITF